MAVFGEPNQQVTISLFSTIAAFVIHLIGFATPFWYKTSGLHKGLWVTCIEFGGIGCQKNKGASSTLEAAQAFECLAFIAFLVAIASAIAKIHLANLKKKLLFVSAITNFAAVGFSLLGVIVFASEDGYKSDEFHFSFAFCIIASLIAIVAGVLAILGWKKLPAS